LHKTHWQELEKPKIEENRHEKGAVSLSEAALKKYSARLLSRAGRWRKIKV